MQTSLEWAEKQLPSHAFFDPRLHKRSVLVMASCIDKPMNTIPQRCESEAEFKA